MLIYRVEAPNGRGVCRVMGSPLCKAYCKAGGQEVEHASFGPFKDFLQDELTCDHPENVFGFPSLKAFHTWFPDRVGLEAMKAKGAKLVPYEVDEPELASPFQCIFNKAKAVRHEPLELTEVANA